MGDKLRDIFTIMLSTISLLLLVRAKFYDLIILFTIGVGSVIIIGINIITIILDYKNKRGSELEYQLNIAAMIIAYVAVAGFLSGSVLAVNTLLFLDISIIPFAYYLIFSFILILQIQSTMSKVPKSTYMVLSVPVLLIGIAAKLLVTAWDLVFPPRVRELIPYLDVTRTFILSFTQILAKPERIETEEALDNLDNVAGQMEEIAEGYALRKGIGQGIDIGLTIVVFAFFGVLAILTDDLGIPPAVVALLFSSLALAFSTFAGFFGPFYGLAGRCKEFTLRRGNYRAAAIYKAVEDLFAIPFMAATAGFLFLDLPPIDTETLEDFKDDMEKQINEITDSITSLLGRNKGAVPRKTQKMIAQLTASAEANLARLDFRNIREETAREFALTYFQHEFSWKPWKRKRAVKEFAEENHFDLRTAEETLKLIGYKIDHGQMGEDMVNNVMVSSALKGIIQMEKEYQEYLEDMELGQTCTGLAFGARQFLKDHYVVRSTREKVLSGIKHFFLGISAVPAVIIMSYHNYANRFFDKLVDTIRGGIFQGRALEFVTFRFTEVFHQMQKLPTNIRKKVINVLKIGRPKEEKAQRNWQIRRKIKRVLMMIWEVLVFPFTVIFNISKWIYRKISGEDTNTKAEFEAAVAHAALVQMYNELNDRLVKQTHVSTGY